MSESKTKNLGIILAFLVLILLQGCGEENERPEYYDNDFDWGYDIGADEGYDQGWIQGYQQGYSDAKKGKRPQY